MPRIVNLKKFLFAACAGMMIFSVSGCIPMDEQVGLCTELGLPGCIGHGPGGSSEDE
jgi:hypothetical protein